MFKTGKTVKIQFGITLNPVDLTVKLKVHVMYR
jgi:hypothetical protein